MTLADAARRLAADPMRLGAVRMAWNPPLHSGYLCVTTAGQFVAKSRDLQRQTAYTLTIADLIADDWDVRDAIEDNTTAATTAPIAPKGAK